MLNTCWCKCGVCGGRTLLLALAVAAVCVGVSTAHPWSERYTGLQQEQEQDDLVIRIRRRVMEELGLTHSPVKNATDEEMETVLREYRRLQALQLHHQHASPLSEHHESTLEVVGTVTEGDWSRRRRSLRRRRRRRHGAGQLTVHFPLEESQLGAHDYVTGGSLRLFVRRPRGGRSAGRLVVYRLDAGGKREVASKPLEAGAGGWVSVDAGALAQDWRERPGQQLGVLVVCRGCGHRRLARGRSRRHAPRLTVRYRRIGRARRSPAGGRDDFLSHLTKVKGAPTNCTRGNKRRCCRQKMYVNFKELGGLDFIIEPPGFKAYYCRGKCPASYNVANDHALLQSWIHQRRKKGNKRLPKTRPPCCAPSRLSALTIVHLDDNGKPKITYWENVVAEECKCS